MLIELGQPQITRYNCSDILESDVVDVISDDSISEYEVEHQGQVLTFYRTTESGWNDMFYADFSITTV